MACYIVTTDQCYLEGEHIPKGWMLEFVVELPTELTDHVTQAYTREDIDTIRNGLTNTEISYESDN